MSIRIKMRSSLAFHSSFVLSRDISLKQAILETLAYSDVFSFPLTADEIQRYLPIRATLDDVANCLAQMTECVASSRGYYFLTGRDDLANLREERARFSEPVFRRAIFYGHILAVLPFIRMVGLTGSLAVYNANEKADLDYMLVAASGHVWTARLFALLLGKFTIRFGHSLCPNLILSEHALEWQKRDLYAARELCQMVPVAGLDIYARLRRINAWTERFLPNVKDAPYARMSSLIRRPRGQWMLEQPLSGALGDRLEAWEMKRKIERFKRQKDFGPETVFSADICQGNFDHHSSHTRDAFRDRLALLGLKDDITNGEG